jgi:hypothetical protein
MLQMGMLEKRASVRSGVHERCTANNRIRGDTVANAPENRREGQRGREKERERGRNRDWREVDMHMEIFRREADRQG